LKIFKFKYFRRTGEMNREIKKLIETIEKKKRIRFPGKG